MTGTIYWGINNIFGVVPEGDTRELECRLKGKVLKSVEDDYNPLSPGDIVEFERNDPHGAQAMITSRVPRRNAYRRWNKKRGRPQTFAANLDELVLVSSPESPPFRPRFLDRALVMAALENLNVLLVVNKCDQPISAEVEDRLATYQDLGIEVHLCSSKTGEGIAELKDHLVGSVVALVGQSGVGKSSLLNALTGSAQQRVGELSAKYNRGNHTTNYSLYYPWIAEGGGLIDTPGVRELEVFGMEPSQLMFYWPEFKPYQGQCSFSGCRHLHEPGCAVLKALEAGEIHPDRWASYEKLSAELEEVQTRWTP